LLFIRAQQKHNGLFTGADVLAPIDTQGSAPTRNGTQKPVFSSTSAAQKNKAADRLRRRLGTTGAFAKQLELARLSKRQTVD
jgi:hypothetical protein